MKELQKTENQISNRLLVFGVKVDASMAKIADMDKNFQFLDPFWAIKM